MHRWQEARWFIAQIEHTSEFSMRLVAHTTFLHIYLYLIHIWCKASIACVSLSAIGMTIKRPYAIGQLRVKLIWCSLKLILVIQWIFSTNSCNVIDFSIITNFTISLTYFRLLVIFMVIVPLYQQIRGTLSLDIVRIVPNLTIKIKFDQFHIT